MSKKKTSIADDTFEQVVEEVVEATAKDEDADGEWGHKAPEDITVDVNKHGYAQLPVYKTKGSAGCDVHANITMPLWIKPGETRLIPTGLKVKVPEGYCLKLYPRSGIALGKSISLINCVGIIDSDFREEVGVALVNHGDNQFEVKRGDRIAQLVLEKVEQVSWNVKTNDEWQVIIDTEVNTRSGGFGSTGSN